MGEIINSRVSPKGDNLRFTKMACLLWGWGIPLVKMRGKRAKLLRKSADCQIIDNLRRLVGNSEWTRY